MFERLTALGFDIAIRNHAGAILGVDFPDQVREIEDALVGLSIPVAELIDSGGGEAKSTQRLRHALNGVSWLKHNFDFQLIVDGVETVATSHEIDHVRRAAQGVIALGECQTFCVSVIWSMLPTRSTDDDDFQRTAGRVAEGLQAA